MTDGHDARADFAFSFVLSGHPAFARTAGVLAARVGRYVGCGAEDAAHLGDAVGRVLGDAVARSSGNGNAPRFEVLFRGTDQAVKVLVSVAEGQPDTGFSFEDALVASGGDGSVRALVDRVEYGADGARSFCRLTRRVRLGR
jgi:hypothetical protein